MEEMQTGVEVGSEAGSQETEVTAESNTGVETQSEAGTESADNTETAWAKRINAIKQKTEQEVSERYKSELQKLQEQYKDYDTHKELSQYFQEINNMDALTLKERIELDRLQARAEQQQMPAEALKRIEELEAKAARDSARADELEQQQQSQKQYQEFRTNLDNFAKERNVNSDELHQYMFNNQIGSMEVALKAMKADQLEQQLTTAKEDAIKEYLSSKQAPRVEGAGVPGQTQVDTSKMGWGDIRSRVAAKIQAAFTSE